MDPIGNIEIGSLSINSTTVDNAEGIFSCRLSDVPGFCGQATLEIGVRVFGKSTQDTHTRTRHSLSMTYDII